MAWLKFHATMNGQNTRRTLMVALLVATVLSSDCVESGHDGHSRPDGRLRFPVVPIASQPQNQPQTYAQTQTLPQTQAQAQAQTQAQELSSRFLQMELGGKCAMKGSCSRDSTSRRSDSESASDTMACRCDRHCARYDDCCRDARWTEPFERRVALGASWLLERRHRWHCTRINPIFGDVLLLASCPAHWLELSPDKKEAQLVKERCELLASPRAGDQEENADWLLADPLGGLMPITNVHTGVTYANSYCLRCNSRPPTNRSRRASDEPSAPVGKKLIYWSPLVNCNYNPDSDDRNELFDLVRSQKGRALSYSYKHNRWFVRTQVGRNRTTAGGAEVAEVAEEGEFERECSLMPTMPESIGHAVRHCRLNTIDTCPSGRMSSSAEDDEPDEEMRRARFECRHGHKSLVYSQTSEAVYFNLACAKCNRASQVLCEPRLMKKLTVERFRVPMATNPLGYMANGGPQSPLEDELGAHSRSGGPIGHTPISGSFSVLLDLYGSENGASALDNRTAAGAGDSEQLVGLVHLCADAERQVYDPFLLTCRDIVCGLNHKFVDGACVRLTEDELRDLESSNLGSGSASVNPAATATQGGDIKANMTAASDLQASSSGRGFVGAPSSSVAPLQTQSQSPAPSPSPSPSPSDGALERPAVKLADGALEGGASHSTNASSKLGQLQVELAPDLHPPSSSAAPISQSAPIRNKIEPLVVGVATSSAQSTTAALATTASTTAEEEEEDEHDDVWLEMFARLNVNELPLASAESRRSFAECAKILVAPEHYRVFTLAQLQHKLAAGGAYREPAPQPNDTSLESGGRGRAPRPLSLDARSTSWAFVALYNLTLASSQFELVRFPGEKEPRQADDMRQFRLLVCSPFKSDLAVKFQAPMVYLTTCCLIVSIASLVAYLLLYVLSTFDLRHLVVEMSQAGRLAESLRTSALDSKNRDSRASNETSHNAVRSQSLSSRGVACLAAALLAAYLLFIMGHQTQEQSPSGPASNSSSSSSSSSNEPDSERASNSSRREPDVDVAQCAGLSLAAPSTCKLIAAATYCFFLLAFNWMFLLSYDIWRTLRLATCHLRAPVASAQSRRFLVYAALAVLSALALGLLALFIDLAAHSQPETAARCARQPESLLQREFRRLAQVYRPKFGQRAGSCWFANRRSLALFFGFPVTLIMLTNLAFFLHSSYMVIKTSTRSSPRMAARASACSKAQAQMHQPTGANFLSGLDSSFSSSSMAKQQAPHAPHAPADSQAVDFAQQNSLTTSSLSSVRTIQSSISMGSMSHGEDDISNSYSNDDSNSNATNAAHSIEDEECAQAKSSEQRSALEAAGHSAGAPTSAAARGSAGSLVSISAPLRGQAAVAGGARSPVGKQLSSSSLLSISGDSQRSSVSLASNLAHKYDHHLSGLTAFISSVVKDYRLYCRLSTIMGLTWLTGLLASVVDQSDALWYLFVLLNTLQGLFIFVAFGFKRSRLTNLEIVANYLAFKVEKWSRPA